MCITLGAAVLCLWLPPVHRYETLRRWNLSSSKVNSLWCQHIVSVCVTVWCVGETVWETERELGYVHLATRNMLSQTLFGLRIWRSTLSKNQCCDYNQQLLQKSIHLHLNRIMWIIIANVFDVHVSAVKSIDDMVCRTKAILVNRSHASRVGGVDFRWLLRFSVSPIGCIRVQLHVEAVLSTSIGLKCLCKGTNSQFWIANWFGSARLNKHASLSITLKVHIYRETDKRCTFNFCCSCYKQPTHILR